MKRHEEKLLKKAYPVTKKNKTKVKAKSVKNVTGQKELMKANVQDQMKVIVQVKEMIRS